MSASGALTRDSRARTASTALLGAGLAAGAVWSCWHLLVLVPSAAADRGSGPAGPLLAVAAALAVIVCARLGLTAVACACCATSTLAGAAGRPARRRCARLALAASPAVLRPNVALLVAGSIAVSTAGAAAASPRRDRPPVTAGATATLPNPGAPLPDPGWSAALPPAELPSPAWTPSRPAAPARPQADVNVVAAPALRDQGSPPVVVRRGDTLWSIAARHLGPDATDAEIAEQWPRWWQANRGRIGDDPDLLLPGQVLVAPAEGGVR
jgi:hypothetical protein